MNAPIPAAVKALCASIVLLAAPVLARNADEFPKDLHRSPPAYDPKALYCHPDRLGIGVPYVQDGVLVRLSGRVFHLCQRSSNNGRTVWALINPSRVPGLRHLSTSISVTLSTLGTYEKRLAQDLERYDDLIETRRLGGALYDVYQDTNRVYSEDLLKKLGGPPFSPIGNLYVYHPEAGQEALPPHSVWCHAEPKNIAENDSYQCFIHTDYHGLDAGFAVTGGGSLFRPMRHDLFPALLQDMLLFLRTADVTDDPVRQACIRDGFAWQEDKCVEGTGDAAR